MHRYELEDSCDDKCVDVLSRDAKLTDEERLEKYKRYLEDDLDEKLKDIEYEKKADAIKKEFEEKNKEKIAKVKEYHQSINLSRLARSTSLPRTEYTFLSKEEIDALKKRYKELEARQIEILDNCTSEDFLLVTRAAGQVNALVDEYSSIEKLKLILVDRIKSNILRDCLNLACENFEKSQLTFKQS